MECRLTKGVTGSILDDSTPGHRLDFVYKIVRVWEIPVGTLLSGGIGTLPLAPIAAVTEQELPGVIDAMKRRTDTELPAQEARELWTATRILMGLRWLPDLVGQLLHGVQGMKESATYQEIVREGMQEGREQGIVQGRTAEARSLLLRQGSKRFGPPDAAVRERLEAIVHLPHLEALFDRVLDGTCTSWGELLG